MMETDPTPGDRLWEIHTVGLDLFAIADTLRALATAEMSSGEPVPGETVKWLSGKVQDAAAAITEQAVAAEGELPLRLRYRSAAAAEEELA
ncbi:MAG TPA: hypothetical protein VME92_13385 [Acetobacteraceae bacterium]|nr:hypothetical protein [Acetobacteraceae bacterium]